MNLILIHPNEWPPADGGQILVLTDERLEHLKSVIKPEPGTDLKVGLLNGMMGIGRLISISAKRAELAVSLRHMPPPPLPLTLVLALPRPLVLSRVIQSCTSLGVKQIHLIQSSRVEKSYWQSPHLLPDKLHQQLILGLQQARDTLLPEIHHHQRFRPFIEDQLPQLMAGKRCYVGHPLPEDGECPSQLKEPTLLAVGPEGGFIDGEIQQFQALGFDTISLGPRILKVETAVTALISKLFL